MTSQVDHRDVVVHVPAHLDPLRDLHPVVSYSLAIHIPEVAAVDLSFLRCIYEFVADEVIPAFQGRFGGSPYLATRYAGIAPFSR